MIRQISMIRQNQLSDLTEDQGQMARHGARSGLSKEPSSAPLANNGQVKGPASESPDMSNSCFST